MSAIDSKLYEFFPEAAALDGDEREEFLRRNCGDDPALRASLEALLINDRTDSFLELLNKAKDRIGERFAGRPEVRATVRQVLGTTYANLGLMQDALEQFERAFARRRDSLGPTHRLTLQSMVAMAGALDGVGRLDDAEELLVEAVRLCRQSLGSEDATTLNAQAALGEALQTLGRYDEAEPLLQETLETQRRVLPDGEEQPGHVPAGSGSSHRSRNAG